MFTTEYIPLTCYLHASKRLKFIGCAGGNNGKVVFEFDDPLSIGTQIHAEFEGGAECSAVGFYQAMRYLRRVMGEFQGGRKGENHEHSRY